MSSSKVESRKPTKSRIIAEATANCHSHIQYIHNSQTEKIIQIRNVSFFRLELISKRESRSNDLMVRKIMYYWDNSMHLNGILHDKLVICLTFYFSCISFDFVSFSFHLGAFHRNLCVRLNNIFFLQLMNGFLYRAFGNLFFMPLLQIYICMPRVWFIRWMVISCNSLEFNCLSKHLFR